VRELARSKSASRDKALSAEAIVSAALRVIANDGASALTMRVLADELGVSPMATYYYVRNKEALLRLVGDAVLSEVVVESPNVGTWDLRLRSLIVRQREALKRYPGLQEALSDVDMEQRRRLEDAEFDILLEAGFAPALAMPALRTLLDWSVGNAFVETSGRNPDGRWRSGQGTRAQRATLDPSSTPVRTADDYFALGLDAVIAGIRATLEAGKPGRRPRRRR
jgi:AcrR family transcriptional regulator